MKIQINGADVELVFTGRVSKGGKEIHEVKGLKLKDGTDIYLTAYLPLKQEEAIAKSPTIRKGANQTNQAKSEGVQPNMAEMIAAAVAQALKAKEVTK